MRIVIDMQGAQAENRLRGIGRYTVALVKAIVRQRGQHEIILALNGHFAHTVESLRAEFDPFLPQQNIRVWKINDLKGRINQEDGNCRLSELTYEGFLVSQDPDFVFVTSLFEGFVDGAITCVHRLQAHVPVAVTVFDLIPYIRCDQYLKDPMMKRWYLEKIEDLKRADIWLSISDSSRQEGIENLGLPESRIYNVSTDAGEEFRKITIPDYEGRRLRDFYGLKKPYVMYTGGIDYRKNVDGLIRSYARLPEALRKELQLAIICSIQSDARMTLEKLARQCGLKSGELVLTGFVPDEDLVALYNMCELFVFPSLHEGFGLPALEAMRCGAPVIASNTSSLPEVVGWEQALFDPDSDESIAKLIERGLTDCSFRDELLARQAEQTKKFSWDEGATRALAAMVDWHTKKYQDLADVTESDGRPRLAYVSPIPPARSGIADYSAELLPELGQYYDIELIVDQPHSDIQSDFRERWKIRSPGWFLENSGKFDRIIYHFGNSSFHRYMFELLDRIPGVVVLHDFFLSGAQAYREVGGMEPGACVQGIYQSHGYQALSEWFDPIAKQDVLWRYPINLPILQRALGVIVHSKHSLELARSWFGTQAGADWTVIPHLRQLDESVDRNEARSALGFDDDDLIVCSFGVLGPTKLNHRLLKAWLDSSLGRNPRAHLVFVGQNAEGEYGKSFAKTITDSKAHERITVTGWADANTFQLYLAAADIGVQLRTLSRGETSGTVLDCMGKGLATIINSHGSMSDIEPTVVWALPDEFTDEDLSEALIELANQPGFRRGLGRRAREILRRDHSPQECAKRYRDAIEDYYRKADSGLPGLIERSALVLRKTSDLVSWADNLSANFPPTPRPRQLLVDVSELVRRDARSGIQRVVRAILKEWIRNPPPGYQIQPVYASEEQGGYWYARAFTLNFLDIPAKVVFDEPVEVWFGDVFIGLDLQPHIVSLQRSVLEEWHRLGVKLWFVVYDLLPLLMPDFFVPAGKDIHAKWIDTVCRFDGVACISRAVAEDFSAYVKQADISRQRPIDVRWFHLGADVSVSEGSRVISKNENRILGLMASAPCFLMVGTIEPRKAHTQVLDAFELLWKGGVSAHLVIVGKQGWMVDRLIERLAGHPQLNKHLFWLDGAGDAFLEKAYEISSCLIAASHGEGFGLPLIEAAQHKLPVLARDIPVFREVAGDHAFYFEGDAAEDLAEAVKCWLALRAANAHPSSAGMPWLTWKDSARRLLNLVIPEDDGSG